MKNLAIFALMTFSLQVYAASSALITLEKSSGFSPRPELVVITVSEKGIVSKQSRTSRITVKENLAKFSDTALQTLKDKIEKIEDDAILIDPNPKAPRCTDAPSTIVTINKGGKDITLYMKASCHTSQVETKESRDLVDIISAFERL